MPDVSGRAVQSSRATTVRLPRYMRQALVEMRNGLVDEDRADLLMIQAIEARRRARWRRIRAVEKTAGLAAAENPLLGRDDHRA